MKGLEYFEALRQEFMAKDPQVQTGNMMRAEAIRYDEHVFAFYAKEGNLVVKLGTKELPDPSLNLKQFNPFKNKPPMKRWFVLPQSQGEFWKEYCEKAYLSIQKEA